MLYLVQQLLLYTISFNMPQIKIMGSDLKNDEARIPCL